MHRASPQDQSPRFNSNPSPLESIRETPVLEQEEAEVKDEPRHVKDIMATVTWPQRDPSLSERRLRSNPSPLAAIPEQERNQAPFRSRLAGGQGLDAAHNKQEPEVAEEEVTSERDDPDDDNHTVKPLPLVRDDQFPWQHEASTEHSATPQEEVNSEVEAEDLDDVAESAHTEEEKREKVVPVFEAPSRIEERLRARREKKEKERAEAEERERRSRSEEGPLRRHGVKPQRVRASSIDSGVAVGAPAALESRMQERRERKEREERVLAELQHEEEERRKRVRRTPVVMTPVYQPEASDYSSKFRRSRDNIDIPKL